MARALWPNNRGRRLGERNHGRRRPRHDHRWSRACLWHARFRGDQADFSAVAGAQAIALAFVQGESRVEAQRSVNFFDSDHVPATVLDFEVPEYPLGAFTPPATERSGRIPVRYFPGRLLAGVHAEIEAPCVARCPCLGEIVLVGPISPAPSPGNQGSGRSG